MKIQKVSFLFSVMVDFYGREGGTMLELATVQMAVQMNLDIKENP